MTVNGLSKVLSRSPLLLEVCIDSVESALAAQAGGAGRVELCADLRNGGVTPTAEMIRAVRDAISIAMHVMIRPRPGTFRYTEEEFAAMIRDIATSKELGADGVVLGVLTLRASIDRERVHRLVQAARPMSVTFHRAIDECADVLSAIDELQEVGVDRVLTSGGKRNVADGIDTLRTMIQRAGSSLSVMAGGGLTFENVADIVLKSGVTEIHALTAVSSIRVSSSPVSSGQVSHMVADAERIRAFLNQATRGPTAHRVD